MIPSRSAGTAADGGSSGGSDKRLLPDVQKDEFLHLLDQEKGAVADGKAIAGSGGKGKGRVIVASGVIGLGGLGDLGDDDF